MECRQNPLIKNIDQLLPLYSYRLWNKELLFLWKIKNQRILSKFFCDQFGLALKKINIKYIVPVPPRKGKIKKNGWDQIDELSKYLHFFYGFTILNLLERTTSNEQKKLDKEERLAGIANAYRLKKQSYLESELEKCGKVIPDQVCIVDDVCTTGSTLECCALLLKGYGIRIVKAVTLFTVD